jgi:hypothetical protein
MADIKICEIDNSMFRSRTPGSVMINDAVYYDERGKAVRFSGDLCPEWSARCSRTRRAYVNTAAVLLHRPRGGIVEPGPGGAWTSRL